MRGTIVWVKKPAQNDDHRRRAMAHGQPNLLDLRRDFPAEEQYLDEEAFDAFARAQQSHLLCYFRSHLPSDEDAKDAAQESLMRLLRYRNSEPASTWRPLLFRIASNIVAEFFRRGAVRGLNKHVSLADEVLVSQVPSQEDLIEQGQREALLRSAIVALPPRCRQVYMLSRVDGLTYPQIAKHCGISVKTVEKHIIHALALLQQWVGGRADGAL
ncbi:RNA polymerase sigma factor [Pseudoxanthomonas sacheonensis]|uniref:RNA polymerase sigma-70 factor (ECF subfamily) n=1 Tax=Pseudoxanthomonas sacheonensis TaxID=443615 RepID=A0ABU1RSM5_9GAMM|nr:sigma-70 family RNA polymerase sigma factor [Pseudoxanthomonas sacheonensis]MDR6841305.1 RNA polymerase sigma-70 factor (ECF subfamily) [Pseudoxanthomonas sacheonensis]